MTVLVLRAHVLRRRERRARSSEPGRTLKPAAVKSARSKENASLMWRDRMVTNDVQSSGQCGGRGCGYERLSPLMLRGLQELRSVARQESWVGRPALR
jgi:hypothetical protein